jgi:redox-sensing transcriptional repressor
MASEKTIERLSIYRRLLGQMRQGGATSVYSHDLAAEVGGTAAQVRRDLMVAGITGNPRTGYEVEVLLGNLADFLDTPGGEQVILIGLGNLGRALIPFFEAHHPNQNVVAAIDSDPKKAGRVIAGVRCYPTEELEAVVKKENAVLALLAVPNASAQQTVDRLVASGVRGILNFVPVPLKVPAHVKVENIDMTMSLEKLAYLVRKEMEEKGK